MTESHRCETTGPLIGALGADNATMQAGDADTPAAQVEPRVGPSV